MESVPKTTRLPEKLVEAIKYRTRKEKVDESTAVRQLLSLGVQDYVISLYKQGKLTLREAAKLSNLAIREMLDLLIEHGVKGNVDYSTGKKSLEIIKNMRM